MAERNKKEVNNYLRTKTQSFHSLIKAFLSLSLIIFSLSLNQIERFESLDPFQQVLLGVSSFGGIMIVLVILLTASPNFENTDR